MCDAARNGDIGDKRYDTETAERKTIGKKTGIRTGCLEKGKKGEDGGNPAPTHGARL
jgi:hypothetical protein